MTAIYRFVTLAAFGLCVLTAGPIFETTNYARFYDGADPRNTYPCLHTNGGPCQGSAVAPGTNWTVNYYSNSSVTLGILRGEASVYLTGDNSLGPFSSFQSTGGRAGFTDTYTVAGGSGTGYLTFSFAVTGNSTQTPGTSGRAQFQVIPVVNGGLNWPAALTFQVNNGRADLRIPITFNQPTEFTISFYALAQIFQWQTGAAATANYSNTAILDQIRVADSANQPISNFNITTASGTVYTASGAVPEPSTLLITGAALLLLARRQLLTFPRNPIGKS